MASIVSEPDSEPVSTPITAKQPAVQPEEKPITTTRQQKSTTPKIADLKSVLKGTAKKEVTDSVVDKKDNKPFTLELLKEIWQAFAEKRKIYQATYHLLSQGFEFRDNTVIVPLHNPFQETQLNEIKVELLTHLRQVLQNDSIQLVGELKILKEEDMNHLYMNDKEILNLMIKKNPLIMELKEKFRLDTDS